jgi:hypothetical protein
MMFGSLAYSPDGKLLLAGALFLRDGHIRVWDMSSGENI